MTTRMQIKDEKPRHQVTLSGFKIGRYEVTFKEYDQFALVTGRDLPSDQNWGRGRRPVINVSWADAVAYAQWLAKRTGQPYRLPTEAEWEYACRAGKETTYCFEGDETQLEHYAWYYGNAENRTHPVGKKAANPWGLHDMTGNVWEWVQDALGKYEDAPTDGSAREGENDSLRVLRGGAWEDPPGGSRAASRANGSHDDPRAPSFGFRLARD